MSSGEGRVYRMVMIMDENEVSIKGGVAANGFEQELTEKTEREFSHLGNTDFQE